MEFNGDCLVCSHNNTINDNRANESMKKKVAGPMHHVKKLIKCLLKKRSTYKKYPQPNYFDHENESEDNLANELLENQIFEEIDTCEDLAAVQVFDGSCEMLPIVRGQRYIPVHFARTDAGTFFWTSVATPDGDIVKNNESSSYQAAELQTPSDRWAQA